MEVRPGYRQTDVGVIPEDWEIRTCAELTERIMVGIVIRPTQYYVRQGVPAFRSANIREDGITDTDLVFISDASNALLAKSQTRAGDVLTVRTGYPGTSAVVRPIHARCNCIDILITRPSAKLDSDYLAIWVNSSFGKEQVLRNQGGLAQKHFNVGDMRNLVVALPPLAEQRAIATALSDVDALLGGLDRRIAKKRDLKQAAMQQLLTGQTRLPGFQGKWEFKSLSAICSMKSGEGITSGSIDQFSQYPCYGGNGLRGFTSRFTHDGSYALIGRQGALCGNVFGVEGRFFASEHAIVVTAFAETDIRWLTYVLGKMNLNQYSESSAQPGLSVSKILNLDIGAPPAKVEQTAIAAVLMDMNAELVALEARREKTRALKQAMMQELLTGRTRLV
jgi:type I restriction enzyme S subunit